MHSAMQSSIDVVSSLVWYDKYESCHYGFHLYRVYLNENMQKHFGVEESKWKYPSSIVSGRTEINKYYVLQNYKDI